MAVAALMCGSVGVVLGMIPILAVPALTTGIVALAFGITGTKRAQRGAVRKMVAIWGTVLGIVAIALSIVGFAIIFNVFT